MEQLSLFDLNKIVKETLDKNLEPSYWVVAEIGEMRSNQNGHCYLELVEKEHDKVTARMRATIWSYTYRNLGTWFEGITGQPLQPGLRILCNVVVQFHELYGLSANIKDIDANFTLGERAQRRKKIIAQLVSDGVFDMNKALELPVVPQRVAIITSPTAAGFGDFMDQITQNNYGYSYQIKLFKAIMQGDNACASIINAMLQVHQSYHNFDALIIIRGGGSQVDLDCFDDYDLAAHIAQFPLPIITGIGHERDETIADLVAHTRMKTPTAVAEFLISGIKAFEDSLDVHFSRIYHYTNNVLNLHNQKLATLAYKLKANAKEMLSQGNHKLEHLSSNLGSASQQLINSAFSRLDLAEKSLELLDPQTILRRGYTITTINGKSVAGVKPVAGDIIKTETVDQIIESTVQKQSTKTDKNGSTKDQL